MARTLVQIQTELLNAKNAQADLSSLTSTSQTSVWNLWLYITAYCQFVHENLWDLFKAEIETTISLAPIGTTSWLQSMVFKFQYSATAPQIIQLVNFVPGYAIVDPTLQIVTRCSVKTLPSKFVSIKVAKGDPTPTALSTPELNSLVGMLDDISFAGVQYTVQSLAADKLLVDASIYYNGQYASVIQANVIAGINAFLAAIPFDGIIYVAKLEDAIQAIPGVDDVVLNNVALRPDAIPFSGTTYLVSAETLQFRKYPLFSGYCTTEDTIGETVSDTLVFIPS
jgi:hypothetical protein